MAEPDDNGRFRRWLRTVPQPVKLRLELASGRPPVVLTLARTNANKFAEAEKSVRSMGSDVLVVQALDAHGEVTRVHRLREETDEAPPPQKEPWPNAPDAQMAMVITASNDRAASRSENAWKYSFDKLQAMYEAVVLQLQNEQRRTAQLEAALGREMARREVAVPDAEEGGLDSMINQLLPLLVPKLLQQFNGKPTNGKGDAPHG